jgi:hypothetical protein
MWLPFILTVGIVALVMLGLGVGLLLRGKPIEHTCGGGPRTGPDGETTGCPSCGRTSMENHECKHNEGTGPDPNP